MGDLVMMRQDRLVEFLRSHGPAAIREVANHFDWSDRRANDELEKLRRRRLIEPHDGRWNAID